MPLQNRVTPLGDLIADPARGLVYGNRGCLHDASGRIVRRFAVKRWIACRLGSAAGTGARCFSPAASRSCSSSTRRPRSRRGTGRARSAAERTTTGSVAILGLAGADAIDDRLHGERTGPRPSVRIDELPDGAFVLRDGEPWLVLGAELLRWTPAGYTERTPRPGGRAALVTPPSLVAVLRSGWEPLVPLLHPSAG